MTLALFPLLPFTDGYSTLPAVVLNTWRLNFPKCLDVVGGSNSLPATPLTAIRFGGDGGGEGGPIILEWSSGGNGRLVYEERDVPRAMTAPMVNATTGLLGAGQAEVDHDEAAFQMFDKVPNRATITAVAIAHERSGSSGDPFPAGSKVAFTIRKRDVRTGASSDIVPLTEDPATPAADYNARHDVSFDGLTETVDTENFVYWIDIIGETGVDSQRTTAYAARVTFSVSEQDEAC